MQLTKLYYELKQHYLILDPHADTWELWIKPNKPPSEIFEVAIGTILVQNTNWRNVNQAVVNLKKEGITSFEQLQKMDLDQLKELIRPAGFFNQKAVYLQALSNLFVSYQAQETLLSRNQLLACKGIGKETADSILLYCFQQPFPVVGIYTRRFLARIRGDINFLKKSYEVIQKEQRRELPVNSEILARFHALVVCHGQNRCQKTAPKCSDCFLLKNCLYGHKHKKDPSIAQIQTIICPSKKKR
ncbi:MAG: endonuclease III domain-containing protein [Candidatus Hodarchaeota archaeon]